MKAEEELLDFVTPAIHANITKSLGLWRSWRRGSLRKGIRGWYLRYPAGKGRARPTQFLGPHSELRSRDDAERAAKMFLRKVFAGERGPGSSPPWPEYCESFLREHVPLMRPESQSTTRSVINRHLKPRFVSLRVHEVTPKRLQEWIGTQRTANVPVSTIKHRIGILLTMLHVARDAGLSVDLPTGRLRYPKTNQLKRPREQLVYNAAETMQILAAAGLRSKAAFALALYQGLRASEIVGIAWTNIDLPKGQLQIAGQAQHGKLVQAKTDDAAATVPMPRELTEILTAYRAQCAPEAMFLFPNRSGRPMTSDNLRKRHLYPLCDRLGIPRKGLHAWRRRLGDALSEAGASLPTIQAALRHAHSATTLRYLSPAGRTDVAEALAAAAAGHRPAERQS